MLFPSTTAITLPAACAGAVHGDERQPDYLASIMRPVLLVH